MKLAVTAVVVCICMFTPLRLVAKSPTVKITITSPGQSAPVDIIEPSVREFAIWEGPGVSVNGVPQTSGFIVDWAAGPVVQPSNHLPRHRITFYTGCKRSEASSCNFEEPQLSYVVFYAYDAAKQEGYVYLPGRGEPWYEVNTRSILRSVEGNWFPASRQWQGFVIRFVAGIK